MSLLRIQTFGSCRASESKSGSGHKCANDRGGATGQQITSASVVTPKPANGGQGKTGQREEAGDSVVLPCRLLWRQVHFRTPTPRTTFEYMTMMEKTIEHGGNGGAISQ